MLKLEVERDEQVSGTSPGMVLGGALAGGVVGVAIGYHPCPTENALDEIVCATGFEVASDMMVAGLAGAAIGAGLGALLGQRHGSEQRRTDTYVIVPTEGGAVAVGAWRY